MKYPTSRDEIIQYLEEHFSIDDPEVYFMTTLKSYSYLEVLQEIKQNTEVGQNFLRMFQVGFEEMNKY